MQIGLRQWCTMCLLWWTAVAMGGDGVFNHPLDSVHPVRLVRSNQFTYGQQIYSLDSHHFLVDATADEEIIGTCPYLFGSVRDAMEHLSDGTPDDPMVVYIAPYVYWVDDPDDPAIRVGEKGHEPIGLTVRCQNLHLIGLTEDARHVVLASQRGQTQGAVGNFTMLDFYGDGLQVSNLTMGNFCNVDLEYPLLPKLGRNKRSGAITQAHVAYCHGDRVVARHVRFISRLNMNPLNGAKRILFDHCHMECTDDALTGNGVYLHCDFDFFGQKPFYTTRRTGAVMLDCDFHLRSENSRSYFCKASGPLTLVDCRFHADAPTYVGWTAYPAQWLRCYYSNVTLNGQPYLVEAEHPETSVCMDGLPLLRAYKTAEGYNVAGLLAGDDGWNPLGQAGNVVAIPTSLTVAPHEINLHGGEKEKVLTASVQRHDGYQAERQILTWKVDEKFEKFIQIKQSEDGLLHISSDYDEDEPLHIPIMVSSPDGLEGAAMIHLEGRPLPAPTLRGKPKIRISNQTAHLEYRLSTDSHGDSSEITWYVADTPDFSQAVPVAASHEAPKRDLILREGEEGKYIIAAIRPRHARSSFGDTVKVVGKQRVRRRDVAPGGVYETDFHDFYCGWQPLIKEGCWTVDGYKPSDTAEYPWSFDSSKPMWEYGEGFNGAVGKGLLQAQRGARMMFTPAKGTYEDMEVLLDVDPTKTAGQGFGSATGQYMDVGIKFNTRTLTGCALRIIRTTKYAKAVDFLLVRYDHGAVTPITDPVSAVCYRTGCHILLRYADGQVSAHVTTDTPLSVPDDPVLQTEVSLSAAIEPDADGGFIIQHTGSCGESTTMLHHLRIKWQ